MMDKYILDGKRPKKATLLEWSMFMDSPARILSQDRLDGILVSTVFLGIDHSFEYGSDPVLFETMIFGGPHDGYQERYTSYDEAIRGHSLAHKVALSPKKE